MATAVTAPDSAFKPCLQLRPISQLTTNKPAGTDTAPAPGMPHEHTGRLPADNSHTLPHPEAGFPSLQAQAARSEGHPAQAGDNSRHESGNNPGSAYSQRLPVQRRCSRPCSRGTPSRRIHFPPNPSCTPIPAGNAAPANRPLPDTGPRTAETGTSAARRLPSPDGRTRPSQAAGPWGPSRPRPGSPC